MIITMLHIPLDAYQIEILQKLGNVFYQYVPLTLSTYCSVTSRISCQVLSAFDIEAELVPCQMWYVTATNNFVIGFLGNQQPSKWDGHVICVAGDCFIDAATHHFNKEFGLEVPKVIVSKVFNLHTQVISRVDINDQSKLWWHEPPSGIDISPPIEPQELIDQYASVLIKAINKK